MEAALRESSDDDEEDEKGEEDVEIEEQGQVRQP